ncbi:MAG: GNAT family N-acetyltransferase [Nocardioides sp.]
MTDLRSAPVGANLEAFFAAVADTPILRRAGVRDALVFTSDIPFPMFNMVAGADFLPGREEERTGDLADLMTAHGLPWLWWETPGHRPHEPALEARGLHREGVPGMYVELAGRVDPRTELRIDPVGDGDLAAYLDVFMEGFAMPEFVRVPMGELFVNALDPELFVHLLAREGDHPVACGTVFLDDGTAGIYNVAVPERHRGRGLGYAMTAALMNVGVDAGCSNAILHATELGRPIYERLGFVEVCQTPQWIWMPPESA